MPPSKRDRRSVMDLDFTTLATPPHSRKSSLSLNEKISSSAILPNVHHRRLSASHIIPLVSQSLLLATANGLKRSPLAPLDPQLSVTLNTDIGMADDEDMQMGRKLSITLTNATRPTPYSQRNIPRRPHPNQQRRTSLPALHVPTDPPFPSNEVATVELTVSQDEDIYSRLSTFTFGDVPASQLQPTTSAPAKPVDDADGVSPLHRVNSFDTTPRQSIAHASVQSGTGASPPVPPLPSLAHASHGWSSPSEDEDEVRRVNTRSKMRAIDDGSRRPSLPTNDIRQGPLQASSSQGSGYTTEKGKAKATDSDAQRPPDVSRTAQTTKTHPLSSPSSQTDGEGDLDLDTDVDLMAVDYPDRRPRNKTKTHETGDRLSVATFGGDGDGRLSSDIGSVDGDDDDEHEQDHDIEMDEDYEGRDPLRKDSARTWTEYTHGRRRSLPMDIPYPHSGNHQQHSHSSQHTPQPSSYVYTGQRFDDANGQPGPDFEARALAHAQFRRPSRSMDDDLNRAQLHLRRRASRVSVTAATTAIAPGFGSGGEPGAVPSSEPDLRGVAMAHAMAQAQVEFTSPWPERSSSLALSSQAASAAASLAFPPNNASGPTNSPYEGLDLSYILSVSGGAGTPQGDNWSARLSVGSSVAAREGRERENSWAAGWGIVGPGGRRPSTATVNDDTFLRFVKKNDFSYDERRREWSFMREKAEGDGVGLASGERPGQEIWRCLWVGRYKVERVRGKNTDPSKPPQLRLNIKHIPDPYSKGNTRGGPATFIHKHSRASAFSIFRGHALPQRHLKTSSSILLAPKKVQEQFTSTRTTSKLSTHGLLEEKGGNATTSGSGKSTQTISGSSATTSNSGSTAPTSVRTPTTSQSTLTKTSEQSSQTSSKSRDKPEIGENDRKGKGVDRSPIDTTPSSSQTSVGNITTASSNRNSGDADDVPMRVPSRISAADRVQHLKGLDSRPPSSIGGETASVTSEGSHVFSSSLSAWDENSIRSSKRESRHAPPELKPIKIAARGSVASLDEQPVRTSHAEAFATLDPPFIEYLRMHAAHYDGGSDHDSPPSSRFKGLRKLFHTQPIKSSSKHGATASGQNLAVLEGHYTPPWLTMAARSKQEEQERVIKNLNDSFRDVGLLPSFKPNKPRASKKGKRASENVFDQIPDDALYMLLPMWPGETDFPSMFHGEDPDDYNIPLKERQYLLVYYVPMLSKDKSEDKKRSRHSQTSSANSHHSDTSVAKENKNSVVLSSFNILARLVSYTDVYGSGIRIPTTGLSVTGPMSEAIQAIPQIRFQMDDLALIIGFCDRRERGVELVPEGTEKLGLCLPRTSPDPDSDAPLSSLGRAAVEMAWLGALAVMGFGVVS